MVALTNELDGFCKRIISASLTLRLESWCSLVRVELNCVVTAYRSPKERELGFDYAIAPIVIKNIPKYSVKVIPRTPEPLPEFTRVRVLLSRSSGVCCCYILIIGAKYVINISLGESFILLCGIRVVLRRST